MLLDINTPSGKVSLFDERSFAEKPATFQAWWLPVKPAVLVGVLHIVDLDEGNVDRLIVTRDGLAACD